MTLSRLALAAALSALSLGAWAQDDDRDDDRETIKVEKRVHREGGDRPRGHQPPDPELQAQLDRMRELEEKARGLALDARQGTDAQKAAAKAELRKAIGELFDAKLALETSMLAMTEKRVAELKAKIARKKSSREKAIETRLLRMTGEADEWD